MKWKNGSLDQTPPWGYPILFEDVPLPRTAAGQAPTGAIHGKALLDEPAGTPTADPP